ERAILGFSNALLRAGRDSSELGGIAQALAQIAGKTSIQAEEINQLAERLPGIRRLLLETFGTANAEELNKLGKEAFLTGLIDALYNARQEVPLALSDILRRFDQESQTVVGRFGEGFGASIGKGLQQLTDQLFNLGNSGIMKKLG